LFSILKRNPCDAVVLVNVDPRHWFLEENIQTQGADLLYKHGTSILVQLTTYDPLIPLDQLNLAEFIQIHQSFRGFGPKQSTADNDTSRASLRCSKFDESLKISNRAIDENAIGIMARYFPREDSIGPGRKHENIVRDFILIGSLDEFGIRVNRSHECVEVVV
jgi:hypothetical protein